MVFCIYINHRMKILQITEWKYYKLPNLLDLLYRYKWKNTKRTYEKGTNLVKKIKSLINVSAFYYFIFYFILSLIYFKLIMMKYWIPHVKMLYKLVVNYCKYYLLSLFQFWPITKFQIRINVDLIFSLFLLYN